MINRSVQVRPTQFFCEIDSGTAVINTQVSSERYVFALQ